MAPPQPELISPCTAGSCPGTRNSVPREQPTLYHTPLERSRQGSENRQCAPRVPCWANRPPWWPRSFCQKAGPQGAPETLTAQNQDPSVSDFLLPAPILGS